MLKVNIIMAKFNLEAFEQKVTSTENIYGIKIYFAHIIDRAKNVLDKKEQLIDEAMAQTSQEMQKTIRNTLKETQQENFKPDPIEAKKAIDAALETMQEMKKMAKKYNL